MLLKRMAAFFYLIFRVIIGSCNTSFPKVCLYICLSYSALYSLIFCLGVNGFSVRSNTKKIVGKHSFLPNKAFFDMYCKLYVQMMCYGNKVICNEINFCSEKLEESRVEYKNQTGCDVILYPLHVFSDEIAVIVGLGASNNRLYVISDVDEGDWKKRWGDVVEKWKKNNRDLYLFNPFVKSKTDASRGIRKIVKKVRNNTADFAVFPDALPEYTRRSGQSHSYKKSILFGKESNLHAGPFNFPSLMRKDVLPYYIFLKNGRLKIEILPIIEKNNVKHDLPLLIEHVIGGMHYKQWLLWHFPSFFYRQG